MRASVSTLLGPRPWMAAPLRGTIVLRACDPQASRRRRRAGRHKPERAGLQLLVAEDEEPGTVGLPSEPLKASGRCKAPEVEYISSGAMGTERGPRRGAETSLGGLWYAGGGPTDGELQGGGPSTEEALGSTQDGRGESKSQTRDTQPH